ncbi:ARMT1-like domain-containing protein [Methanobrevibacter sp. OttesenSCG-928-K11]|nr:ARMT1-like domain-containing protein [Methanobrevibacter sp. OttesenSCG-928-K11]MDL2246847.1 ARMT1-like domain-containing protein [Methanobrevibacter sp. OttesenSCG-928-K11]MDL2271058.1 ARMT1-like domain-containing protein [Methanobrevibacter sp. OttesenSCG-928-I08]
MKVYYECGPCFLRQAREAMDLSSDDEELKIQLMKEVFLFLAENYNENASSNGTGSKIHKMIKEKTGCYDPYIDEKINGNELALKYLPMVKDLLKKDDSLENYVKIAIIGNLLDFGAFELGTDIEKFIIDSFDKKLAINNTPNLESDLKKHKNLLYLVDNVGEIVFDKLFLKKIKEYDIKITIAVKEKPILNDACMEDALAIGLDDFGEIVSIGTDTVGVVYTEISQKFKEIFDNSDFIISKGLGNYEGLTETNLDGKDVYFLLCAKCSAIAKDLNINLQDMIIIKN